MTKIESDIIEKIKSTVAQTDSSAEIILFGSRARGDAKIDSDWDLLIIINKQKVTREIEQSFTHPIYDIELETGHAISTLVVAKKDWDTKFTVTPFYLNIKNEGIKL